MLNRATADGRIGVRDSKNPTRCRICTADRRGRAFLAGIRSGEFEIDGFSR
ncbi:MAG: DUF397 domain-containing protein [Streptosporangiaceae bacterium]|nr:DUF397 domain-containing protein [Streptosporangiaceae bacterium]